MSLDGVLYIQVIEKLEGLCLKETFFLNSIHTDNPCSVAKYSRAKFSSLLLIVSPETMPFMVGSANGDRLP